MKSRTKCDRNIASGIIFFRQTLILHWQIVFVKVIIYLHSMQNIPYYLNMTITVIAHFDFFRLSVSGLQDKTRNVV